LKATMAGTKFVIFSLFGFSNALKCHICTTTLDHQGHMVGLTDQYCDDLTNSGADQYLADCFENANYCGTELIADWLPNGEQLFKWQRGCRTSAVQQDGYCTQGELTGMQYKDCVVTCTTDGCNNDQSVNDLFALKDESGKVVERQCYSCSSTRDEGDELIDGKSDCFSTPVVDTARKNCPVYANHACFKAKVITDDEEQHFKGCSAFGVPDDKEENEAICTAADVQGQSLLTCKTTCDSEDLCNTLSVQGNGLMCYACEVTFNQQGFPVGWGDMSCFNDLANRHLQFCPDESSTCVSQFEADWRLNGQQTFTMRRGCGDNSTVPNDQFPQCLSASGTNGNFHVKHCALQCDSTADESDDAACNGMANDEKLLKSFSQQKVKNCKTCSDHLDNPEADSDCAKGDVSMPCPIFADAACFSSRVNEQLEGNGAYFSSDTYHGCSAFRITQDSKTCVNVETTEPNFQNPEGEKHIRSVCKESCTNDNCNDQLTELPGDGGPNSHHYCYSCSVTVNHLNQTVGWQDRSCWDNPGPEHEIECPDGFYFCLTDMEVDWMGRGDQYTTVRRSCSATPAPDKCQTGDLGSVYQYKDCVQTCSNNLLSPCNGDLSVADMFPDTIQPVKSCFNCETHPDDDTCGDLNGPDAMRKVWPCPQYANTGCFTSISRHDENGVDFDDIIRGCSTFSQEYSCATTTNRDLDSGTEIEYTTCKEACGVESNCNNEPAVVATENRCYVCSVTVDHQGHMIGAGDISCLDPEGMNSTHIYDCGKESVCETHMEVMWLPMGNQHTIVERRCGYQETAPNLCTGGASNAWMYKDCWDQCYTDSCNNDLEISKNFAPPSGQPKVTNCHTCHHEEIASDGMPSWDPEIPDIYNCKENPSNITMVDCPVWAQAGCFVGDGVQQGEDGNEIVNVYRGCSSFYIEDQICSGLTLDTNVETNVTRTRTSICKNACNEGDDCNTYRFPGWEPPGEGECPDECLPISSSTTATTTTTKPDGSASTPSNPDATTSPANPEETTAPASASQFFLSLVLFTLATII